MPMTLKADLRDRARGAGKPVDLAHLAAQTFGDPALEKEVLGLFLSQAPVCLAAWKSAGGAQARKLAAHTLKGASRGIGAWELAEIAGEAEAPGFADAARLEAEIERVCSYIRSLA